MDLLNQDWEVRSLDDLDPSGLQLVSDFFNEHFPGVFYPKCTPELFTWKLGSGNPAGKGFLTVAMSNGLVVGTASGTRKILIENDKLIEAIEIGDTFTHPNFRKNGKCISPRPPGTDTDKYYTVSIFGRLVSETIARAKLNGVHFIYGTPNENSKPPYLKRLKFKEIDKGNIYSKVILTPEFAPLKRIRWILNISQSIVQIYTRGLSYLILGKNSLYEISNFEFLENYNKGIYVTEHNPNKIYLVNNYQVLYHRYVLHPNQKYRFFQVTVKGAKRGVFISTEVLRSSGVSSFVVSDWLFSDEKIQRSLSLFISKLRSYNRNTETISFWEHGRPANVKQLSLGIFPRKRVSVISKDFRNSDSDNASEFGDFHIGWSDNG
ncbi:MAG: hypothetical protein Q8K48_07190 [Candidatus Planktophila sp.]|nr:hypothetical protein [Candidatus Planktophila sp.]